MGSWRKGTAENKKCQTHLRKNRFNIASEIIILKKSADERSAVAQQFRANNIINVNHHSDGTVSHRPVEAFAQACKIIRRVSRLRLFPNYAKHLFSGFHPKAARLIIVRPKFGLCHRIGAFSKFNIKTLIWQLLLPGFLNSFAFLLIVINSPRKMFT